MSSSRISYVPRPDATPEDAINALASVYTLLLDRYAEKEGGPTTAPDDAKENRNVRAEPNIP